MALYVFVLAGGYYSMMTPRYVLSDWIPKIRAVVTFAAVTSGLYFFVIGNMVLTSLIGVLFAVVSEEDYRISRDLVERGLLEKKYAESGAWRLFYGIFYGVGTILTLTTVTGDYNASFIRESLLTVFRLLYIFTAIFLPFGTFLGGLRLRIQVKNVKGGVLSSSLEQGVR